VEWGQAITLNRIIFPYIFFIGLSALAIGILNSFHIFGVPAATPILFNLAVIGFSTAMVWRYFKEPEISLAVGVLAGGALQFLVQVPALVRQGMRFNFGLSFTHPAIRSVARLMVPRFFGIGIAQINFLVDRVFLLAPRMPRGAPTSQYLADRVMELVLGGYAIAVATAILPMMSHQAAASDHDALKRTLAFAMRIVAFITVPAMVGLVILREPIIRILFQHGQFLADSTRLTARVLMYSALGLPALASVKLIVPAFYSTNDTRTPVIVAGISFLLNIILNLIFLLDFPYKRFQNGGPALATALASLFNFIALFIVFRVRYGAMGTSEILRSFGKISVGAAVMGAACAVGLHYTQFTLQSSFAVQLTYFVGMILGATLLYLGVAWLLRCSEVEEVYGIALQSATGAGGISET
jgi:putative peptidoglycan lipid II flippase